MKCDICKRHIDPITTAEIEGATACHLCYQAIQWDRRTNRNDTRCIYRETKTWGVRQENRQLVSVCTNNQVLSSADHYGNPFIEIKSALVCRDCLYRNES